MFPRKVKKSPPYLSPPSLPPMRPSTTKKTPVRSASFPCFFPDSAVLRMFVQVSNRASNCGILCSSFLRTYKGGRGGRREANLLLFLCRFLAQSGIFLLFSHISGGGGGGIKCHHQKPKRDREESLQAAKESEKKISQFWTKCFAKFGRGSIECGKSSVFFQRDGENTFSSALKGRWQKREDDKQKRKVLGEIRPPFYPVIYPLFLALSLSIDATSLKKRRPGYRNSGFAT